MDELERAIEKLEETTNDCCKAFQTPRVLKKMVREGEKMSRAPWWKQEKIFKMIPCD